MKNKRTVSKMLRGAKYSGEEVENVQKHTMNAQKACFLFFQTKKPTLNWCLEQAFSYGYPFHSGHNALAIV